MFHFDSSSEVACGKKKSLMKETITGSTTPSRSEGSLIATSATTWVMEATKRSRSVFSISRLRSCKASLTGGLFSLPRDLDRRADEVGSFLRSPQCSDEGWGIKENATGSVNPLLRELGGVSDVHGDAAHFVME